MCGARLLSVVLDLWLLILGAIFSAETDLPTFLFFVLLFYVFVLCLCFVHCVVLLCVVFLLCYCVCLETQIVLRFSLWQVSYCACSIFVVVSAMVCICFDLLCHFSWSCDIVLVCCSSFLVSVWFSMIFDNMMYYGVRLSTWNAQILFYLLCFWFCCYHVYYWHTLCLSFARFSFQMCAKLPP